MVRVSLEGSLVMVVGEVAVLVQSGMVQRVRRRLWKFWSGDDVASLVWGGCHEFEAFQSVLLAEPEAGGSGAVVVP